MHLVLSVYFFVILLSSREAHQHTINVMDFYGLDSTRYVLSFNCCASPSPHVEKGSDIRLHHLLESCIVAPNYSAILIPNPKCVVGTKRVFRKDKVIGSEDKSMGSGERACDLIQRTESVLPQLNKMRSRSNVSLLNNFEATHHAQSPNVEIIGWVKSLLCNTVHVPPNLCLDTWTFFIWWSCLPKWFTWWFLVSSPRY